MQEQAIRTASEQAVHAGYAGSELVILQDLIPPAPIDTLSARPVAASLAPDT